MASVAGGGGLSSIYPVLLPRLKSVPKPNKHLAYGTAGFRDRAELLDSTLLRMGVLAAIRSRATGSAAIGLMVTASHNPACDNGVKLVDVDGGMLAVAWEAHAIRLANADDESLECVLLSIASSECGGDWTSPATVMVARDTRPHSGKLAALALEGAQLAGAEAMDLGLLTTPQLHHVARVRNGVARGLFDVRPEWEGEQGYYRMLSEAFRDLIATADTAHVKAVDPRLVVDAAFGIGEPQFRKLAKAVVDACPGVLRSDVRNGVGEGELNENAGAEHVQKTQTPPAGVDADRDRGARLASFDGDADRLVYHYFDLEGAWHLLDGDKIAVLFADFVSEELRAAMLPPSENGHTASPDEHAHAIPTNHHHDVIGTCPTGSTSEPTTTASTITTTTTATTANGDTGRRQWSLAVVQTAYANGASTRYLRSKGVPVAFTKTGVKYLHRQAVKYDVGIYFEANGHGTIHFSHAIVKALQQHLTTLQPGSREHLATTRLLLSRQLINQAVGDAMSDALFIEAVLRVKGWNVEHWDGLYKDLPSRQTKLRVRDRTVITTNEDETRVVHPPELQAALDAAMARYAAEHGRVFVRPSGTEDAVRVYTEATTQAVADALAIEACHAVYDIAGGVGEKVTGFVA